MHRALGDQANDFFARLEEIREPLYGENEAQALKNYRLQSGMSLIFLVQWAKSNKNVLNNLVTSIDELKSRIIAA